MRTAAVALASTVGAVFIIARAGVAWRKGTHSYFEEQKIGTLLSGAVLFGSAVLCWMTARRSAGPMVNFWLFNCALFALAGFDDLFRLHEKADLWLQRLVGADPNNPATDHVDDLLVAIYPACAMALWYRHRRAVLAFRWMVLTMAAAFVAFAGMAVLDWAERHKAIDESLKLLTGVLILLAFLSAYAQQGADLARRAPGTAPTVEGAQRRGVPVQDQFA